MNPKLTNDGDPSPETGGNPTFSQTRRIPIPADLLEKLHGADAETVNDLIKQYGAAIGFEAVIKLACAIGDTPPSVQGQMARFLVEHSSELVENQGLRNDDKDKLKTLSLDDLIALGRAVEAQRKALPAVDAELSECSDNQNPVPVSGLLENEKT